MPTGTRYNLIDPDVRSTKQCCQKALSTGHDESNVGAQQIDIQDLHHPSVPRLVELQLHGSQLGLQSM